MFLLSFDDTVKIDHHFVWMCLFLFPARVFLWRTVVCCRLLCGRKTGEWGKRRDIWDKWLLSESPFFRANTFLCMNAHFYRRNMKQTTEVEKHKRRFPSLSVKKMLLRVLMTWSSSRYQLGDVLSGDLQRRRSQWLSTSLIATQQITQQMEVRWRPASPLPPGEHRSRWRESHR